MRDGEEIDSMSWEGDRASAEEHARSFLEFYKVKHGANSVQVVEAATKKFLYWYCPD